jgi:hypothetical protein
MWKNCGTLADRLCTICRLTILFDGVWNKTASSPVSGAASRRVSLARRNEPTRIIGGDTIFSAPKITVSPIVFKQTIHGRSYVIEVRAVGQDRWRAHLARRGPTTALMPFYGATPEEAAGQLAGWLTRANGARTTVEVAR